MEEPYVLQQIKLAETSGGQDQTNEMMKKRIIIGLVREANYRGPGCSQSARVAALAKLASIHGMDAVNRTQTQFLGADGQPVDGGVFVVPGIMTTEDWEKAAEAQQAALVANPAPVTPTPIGSAPASN